MDIVRAASVMNMCVARIPAPLGRIDPALQLNYDLLTITGYLNALRLAQIFRPAPTRDLIFPIGQQDIFSVRAIDLWVKGHIRRDPSDLRRIHMMSGVLDDERGHAADPV